ncbi:MAG TPA: tetratricopeptide repeat protein [Firmicutes bacterium]|nr:tetratricopeptide repeat protein [Bacillota bacterium]
MKRLYAVIILLAVVFMAGCGPERKQESIMDTPESHYKEGMKYIEVQQWDKAFNEFTLAKTLDAKYAPAYEGMAYAYLGEGKNDSALKMAKECISKDSKYWKGHIVMGKVYLAMDEPKDALKSFTRAHKLNERSEVTTRMVGYAHYRLGEYEDARSWYTNALQLKSNDTATMKYLDELNEMQMAVAGMGKAARRIAMSPAITRADAAALFVDEINVENLFKKEENKGFQEYGAGNEPQEDLNLPDVAPDFWAYSFISKVVEGGIIDVYPDGNYHPERAITKADFAVFISRVLMKIADDPKMATQFIGTPSPFADVPGSHFAFNAIMICTSRGILDTDISGNFGIDEKVPGRKAIMAIKKLKTILN